MYYKELQSLPNEVDSVIFWSETDLKLLEDVTFEEFARKK